MRVLEIIGDSFREELKPRNLAEWALCFLAALALLMVFEYLFGPIA